MKKANKSTAAFLFVAAMTTLVLFAGCDDDGPTRPRVTTPADFEGIWIFRTYELTSTDEPDLSFELIDVGGTITFEVDRNGTFMGNAFVPEEVGGPEHVDFNGEIELVNQDSLAIEFNREIPLFLKDFLGAFTLDADTLIIVNDEASFDFDFDGTEEPAELEARIVRTVDPFDPTGLFMGCLPGGAREQGAVPGTGLRPAGPGPGRGPSI